MKISLIMATIGRTKEVELFLEALLHQTYENFELIIVDQNQLPVLNPIIEKYNTQLPVIHITSSNPGLSSARNLGIRHADGDIISFPDDDCLYPPNLLENVAAVFQTSSEIDTISTSWHDTVTNSRLKSFKDKEEWITNITIWTQVSSITLFIKSEVFHEVGTFDEQLGIGPHSVWKGAEDKDLPIRILRSGKKIRYIPFLYVLHPAPVQEASATEEVKIVLDKTFQYSAAAGFVMCKHHYPFHLKLASILIILGKLIMNFLTFNKLGCQIRWASLKGRLCGLLQIQGRGN
ncbi:glycosyltransferase family A protein [Metabacillus fastidiosus]|uniref:glycosyltransferase family 2 protein n=1 Tax=Metabacillus fastidiosus TaxID=1458 RepID=UPI003D2D7163